jgi:hypothetical protein
MTNHQHLFSSRLGIHHRVNSSRYCLKCASTCRIWEVAAHANSFIYTTWAVRPETIAAMSEVLEAACERIGDTDQPEVAREVIAGRIIAAARTQGAERQLMQGTRTKSRAHLAP